MEGGAAVLLAVVTRSGDTGVGDPYKAPLLKVPQKFDVRQKPNGRQSRGCPGRQTGMVVQARHEKHILEEKVVSSQTGSSAVFQERAKFVDQAQASR